MSSPRKGIDDLRDDDIEGSRVEYNIFTELFFWCNCGNTLQRCLVTRAIIFEPELNKHGDAPLSSNSLQSAQASSKDYEDRDDHAASDKNDIIEPDCSHETLSDDQNDKAKRLKLSIGQFAKSKVINNGVSHPDIETCGKTITCRLVESSSGSVTFSSYLLKKPIAVTTEGGGKEDDPTCQVSCLKDNNCVELVVSKSIASPISEESFAAKVLVEGPCVARKNKFTLSYPNRREKELGSHCPHHSNVPSCSRFMKDPRCLIQDQINHLLEATGWQFELRKRRSSSQRFAVYISPEGNSFHQFPKVWQSLGQSLLGKKFNFCQQTSGKCWTDIEQFCFDLSEALMHINISVHHCDFNKALAEFWILLHPFVIVAFIEKKIGVLRTRNVIGATKGLYIYKHVKSETSLSFENPVVTGHTKASGRLFDSRLTAETESVVVEGNEGMDHDNRDMHACDDESSNPHKGNNVYLGGHDRNFSLPDFLDFAYLQGKHGYMSSRLHVQRLLLDGEIQGTESVICNETSGDDVNTKKKMCRMSKKISAIKGSSFFRREILGLTSGAADEVHYTGQSSQQEFRDSQEIMADIKSPIEGSVVVNGRVDLQDCKPVTKSRKLKQQSDEKTSSDYSRYDDIFESAILQKKYSCRCGKDISMKGMSMKVTEPKCKRKLKSQMAVANCELEMWLRVDIVPMEDTFP